MEKVGSATQSLYGVFEPASNGAAAPNPPPPASAAAPYSPPPGTPEAEGTNRQHFESFYAGRIPTLAEVKARLPENFSVVPVVPKPSPFDARGHSSASSAGD